MTEDERNRISQAIARATRLVAAQPPWKRDILARAAQPTLSTPRPWVDNRRKS